MRSSSPPGAALPPPARSPWRSRAFAAVVLLCGPAYAAWVALFGGPASGMADPQRHARPAAAETATVSAASPGAAERRVVAEVNAPSARAGGTGTVARSSLADLVVLISVDGLRADVIASRATHIRRLQAQGSSAINARTITKSSTLASHASMVSGVDHLRHGLNFNAYRPKRGHIQYPTIFSAAQDAGLTTALFVGKRKLGHLLNPDTESHFEVGGLYCRRVTKLALPYLASAEPGIVFLHLSDPDSAGHQYGWMGREYRAAVARADRCVGQILDALRARGPLERTLVLLTADHGGHDHDHVSHARSDTHIPWIAWGGPARRGVRVQRRVFNTDTAATILHVLGLPMPADIQGKPVLEALAAEPGPTGVGPEAAAAR